MIKLCIFLLGLAQSLAAQNLDPHYVCFAPIEVGGLRAALLKGERPSDLAFDEQKLFRHAHGIYYGFETRTANLHAEMTISLPREQRYIRLKAPEENPHFSKLRTDYNVYVPNLIEEANGPSIRRIMAVEASAGQLKELSSDWDRGSVAEILDIMLSDYERYPKRIYGWNQLEGLLPLGSDFARVIRSSFYFFERADQKAAVLLSGPMRHVAICAPIDEQGRELTSKQDLVSALKAWAYSKDVGRMLSCERALNPNQ